MAAETFEAISYKEEAVSDINRVIERVSKAQTFTLDTAADRVKFFKLPPGAKLLGGHIESADIDTGTPAVTMSLIVTNGTTTKTIIALSTVGQAGGIVFSQTATYGAQTGWKGYTCNGRGWYVAVTIGTAPATVAAGNLQAGIIYTMDTEGGERTS